MWSQLFSTWSSTCGKPALVLKLQCVTEGWITWSHDNTTVCLWGTLWQERCCTSLTLTEITWHKKACCESLKAWKIRAAAAPVHTTHVLYNTIQQAMQSPQKYTKPHQHSLLYYTFLYTVYNIKPNMTEHNGHFSNCLMSRLFHFTREKSYKWILPNVSKCSCILCEGACRRVHFCWEVCHQCSRQPTFALSHGITHYSSIICLSVSSSRWRHTGYVLFAWIVKAATKQGECISLWEGKVQMINKRIIKRSKGKITQAQREKEEGLKTQGRGWIISITASFWPSLSPGWNIIGAEPGCHNSSEGLHIR